jgi:integrase
VAIQWYAARAKGAALLAEFRGATLQQALDAERAGAEELAGAYAEARARARQRTVATLDDLVLAYTAAPEFKRLADSTQAEWLRTLKAVRASPLARLSLRAIAAKGARATILKWRDTMAATPRKADYAMQVLGRVLNWGVDREHLEKNPIAGIESLYRSNRAEIVWTNAEIDAVCAHLSEDAAHAVRFMALTGLRKGDALAVPWNAIDVERGVLVVRTGKGRRQGLRQVCELTPELVDLLDAIPRRATTILTTAEGAPWHPDGLGASFRRAREKAGLGAAGDDGVVKRMHDIRGTTATEKVAAALKDADFQREMGWSGRAAKTAAKYVDPGNVIALKRKIENGG